MKININGNRKSIGYFQSLSYEEDMALNASIFVEDVHRGIMPIGGESRKHPKFTAVIESDEINREKAINVLRSFDKNTYMRNDVKELICDAINEIALNLSRRGWQVYEIVKDDDPQKIILEPFTIKRLLRIVGYYIQCIPKIEQARIKKRFIRLSARDVWKICVPSVLGGTKGYKKILKKMRRFHKPGPDFWLDDMAAHTQTPGFNFGEYILIIKIREARLTRTWGWNRRDSSLENTTEFFYFYRTITFEWAQAVLREHIINELNKLFTRIKIDARIVVNGLPTSQDILRIRQELCDGKIQFEDAYNRTSVF